jgi:hypothetical protein
MAGKMGSNDLYPVEKLGKALLDRHRFWCSWGLHGSSPEKRFGSEPSTTSNDHRALDCGDRRKARVHRRV